MKCISVMLLKYFNTSTPAQQYLLPLKAARNSGTQQDMSISRGQIKEKVKPKQFSHHHHSM